MKKIRLSKQPDLNEIPLTIEKNWIQPSIHCLSPFFSARSDENDISLLVIHNISLPPKQFGNTYIEQLFLGILNPQAHPYFKEIAHLEVSAHCLIRRDGELMQFVALNNKAWHAGISEYKGRNACNDFSIGIELEGADEIPYTEKQYQQLIRLTKLLIQYYPKLTKKNIVGHSQIAPGRKTDPGASFNWDFYLKALE